jgi:hypothetical protein
MIRSWLRRLLGATPRRRTIIKWTASISVLALLVIGSLVATGYQAQRVNLDDGAVWVTNGEKQAIGAHHRLQSDGSGSKRKARIPHQ